MAKFAEILKYNKDTDKIIVKPEYVKAFKAFEERILRPVLNQ